MAENFFENQKIKKKKAEKKFFFIRNKIFEKWIVVKMWRKMLPNNKKIMNLEKKFFFNFWQFIHFEKLVISRIFQI